MRILLSLRSLLACLAILTTLVACGDDSDMSAAGAGGASGEGGSGGSDEPEVDCDGDVPVYADVSAFDKCTQCHSSELMGGARRGAPSSVNLDTYDAAVTHADEAAEEVFKGDMPLRGSGVTITEAQKQDLYTWALCGTPE